MAAGGERTSLKNKMELTFAEAGGACVIGYEVNLVGVAATRRFHVEGFILVGLRPNSTTSSTIVRTHKPHFTRIRIRIHIHSFFILFLVGTFFSPNRGIPLQNVLDRDLDASTTLYLALFQAPLRESLVEGPEETKGVGFHFLL